MTGWRRYFALLCLGVATACCRFAAPATAAPAVAAAVKPAQTFPPDIQKIINRGTLIVAMTAGNLAPFHMVKDGRVTGLGAQLAEGLAKALGVRVTYDLSSRTFDGVIDQVAEGKADIAISKISRSLKRSRRVLFSRPYVKLYHAILINRFWWENAIKDQSMAAVIRGFTGRVGVIAHSAFVGYAHRAMPKADIVGYPTWKDVIAALADGKVTAIYRDELSMKEVVQDHPALALHVKTVALVNYVDNVCMALGPDDFHLQQLVNIYLDDLHLHLTATTLLRRYQRIEAARKEASR